MTNKLGYFNALKAPPLEGGWGEVFTNNCLSVTCNFNSNLKITCET